MPDEKKDDAEILRMIANHYWTDKRQVHISFHDGHFNNGIILELKADFFLFEDFKDGIIPVFFCTVKNISLFKKVEEKK